MPTLLARVAAATLLAAPLQLAQARQTPGIERLAPPTTFLYAAIDDMTATRAAWDRTPYAAMMRDPDVARFLEAMASDMDESLAESGGPLHALREEAGGQWANVPLPGGAAGVALFFAPPHAEAPDEPSLHVLAVGDFGDRAEEFEELLARTLARLAREAPDGGARVQEDEHEGALIRTLTLPEPEQAEPAPEPGMEEEDLGFEEMPASVDPLERSLRTIHAARRDRWIVISTGLDAIRSALDGIGGDDLDSVGELPDVEAALAQHPPGSHARAVMLVSPFVLADRSPEKLVPGAEDIGPFMGGPAGDPALDAAFLRTIGFASVRALSMALDLDAPAGAAAGTVGVLAPERAGLLQLVSPVPGRFSPPGFIGDEPLMAAQFRVRFDGILPLVRALAEVMDPEGTDGAVAQVQGFETLVGPALANLGPDVYFWQVLQRPLTAESEQSIAAIAVRDQETVAQMLGVLAGMTGAAPRDFEGNQIFSFPGAPAAVALGSGFLFIGPSTSVENAMRQAAAGGAGANGLARSETLAPALERLQPGASMYSVSDLRQQAEWSYWQMANAGELLRATLERLGLDPAEHAEDIAQASPPPWFEKLPPLATLQRYLGPVTFEMHESDDGFRGVQLFLPPRE